MTPLHVFLSLVLSGAQAAPPIMPREHVARAIAALGGEPLLRSLVSIEVDGIGTVDRTAQVQGRRPGGTDPVKHEEWVSVDLSRDRAALEYREPRADGSLRWRRFEYAGGERVVVDQVQRITSRAPFAAAPRIRRELIRRIPHLLLLEALDHDSLLRSAPDSAIGARRFHVVGYAPPNETVPIVLYLEAGTARLAGVSYVMDHPGLGDTRVELWFDRYAADPRLGWFPEGHRMLVNGQVLEEIRYQRVLVNDPRIEDAFRVPDDIAARAVMPGTVTRAAPGVYVVGISGFTALFVEFRDFVMAIEAPAQSYVELEQLPAGDVPPAATVAEALIGKIKETIPDKPIRYVTVSHYHNDHSGGARAFWAEGATVLTTPGARGYFEQYGQRPTSIAPDRLSAMGADAPRRIETVTGTRVITDGERTIEVINVGRTLHTDEALVVYFPRERIVYQGDQFYFNGDATFPPRDRLPVMGEFARWLRASGIPVDRIYGTHITGYASGRHAAIMAERPAPPPPGQ